MSGPGAIVDVLVLGGGYTGSLAALVLAARGLRVSLLERSPEPRLVVGESTRNEQNRIHAELARSHGLPELEALGSYGRLRRHAGHIPTWPKEAFYFLTNPARRSDRAAGQLLHQTAPWPVGPDYHCRRDALDAHLLALARARGVEVRLGAEVHEIDVDGAEHAWVGYRTASGEAEVGARLLVDATGHARLLARALDLDEAEPRELTLRSRAIYGHFVGVRRLETVRRDAEWARSWTDLPISRDHTTQHHMDERGWTWVIPFDDGLTSVGAVLNMDRVASAGGDVAPESELAAIVSANPALEAMLADARPIAPLTRTGRLQRRASRGSGERWLMLPPSSGFSDPLLSPGMSTSAAAIARMAMAVDEVLRAGRPASHAFAELERCFRVELEQHTRLQEVLFMAMGDAELFAVVQGLDRLTTHLGGVLHAGRADGSALPPLFATDEPAVQELIADTHRRLCEAGAREAPPPGLAAELSARIREADPYRFLRSRFGASRRNGVHVHAMAPLLRWTSEVASGRDERVSTTARAAARRWRRGLLSGLGPRARARSPETVPTIARAPARGRRGAGALLALRHVAIQLGLLR